MKNFLFVDRRETRQDGKLQMAKRLNGPSKIAVNRN